MTGKLPTCGSICSLDGCIIHDCCACCNCCCAEEEEELLTENDKKKPRKTSLVSRPPNHPSPQSSIAQSSVAPIRLRISGKIHPDSKKKLIKPYQHRQSRRAASLERLHRARAAAAPTDWQNAVAWWRRRRRPRDDYWRCNRSRDDDWWTGWCAAVAGCVQPEKYKKKFEKKVKKIKKKFWKKIKKIKKKLEIFFLKIKKNIWIEINE